MMISPRLQQLAFSCALLVTGSASAQEAGVSGRPDAIQVTQTGTHYVLTVPVSRLVMQFPKGALVLAQPDAGGATRSPRYFYFQDREASLIASGWFESEQGFVGIQKFWDDEVASWNKRLPAPQNVAFSKKTGWETIAYEVPVPTITNTNRRAHRVQAGTWIDLHLSLTNRQPVREARARLDAFLDNVIVSEKK